MGYTSVPINKITYADFSPRNDPAPLRFGIMYKGPRFERWQVACLDGLLAVPGVEAVVLILENGAEEPPSGWHRLVSVPYREFLFHLWCGLVSRPSARRTVEMPPALTRLQIIRCNGCGESDGSTQPNASEVQAIQALELDFILRFSTGPLPAELLRSAHSGVWAFHHGDWTRYPAVTPCFWEIYNGEHVTGAALMRLGGQRSGGIVLKQGFLQTRGHSYAQNADRVYARSACWPAQVCIDIRNGASDYLTAAPTATEARAVETPSNRQMLHFLARTCRNAFVAAHKLLFRHDHWNVGVVKVPIARFLDSTEPTPVEWLAAPPRDEFFADPFGVMRNGELTILCEHLDYRDGRRCIVSIAMDGKARGRPSRVEIGPVPRVPMSYPYLVEEGGILYCIPETHEAREVRLYRVEQFPDRWTKVAILIENVAAVDSTIFQHGRLWWLACADQDRDPRADLFLWYAPGLEGPWRPHPGNPVKTDVRSARPGGTPFVHEGRLYRPAQDCSTGYGRRMVINRVLRLSPTEFEEEPAAFVDPDRHGAYRDGVHTLSAVGDLTLIDGKREVFIPSAFVPTFMRLARKMLWPPRGARRDD